MLKNAKYVLWRCLMTGEFDGLHFSGTEIFGIPKEINKSSFLHILEFFYKEDNASMKYDMDSVLK